MVDLATMVLLSDTVVKNVFEEILKNRSAVFKELVSSVGKSPNDPNDRKEIEQAVTRLMNADLIKERPAPIEDFNSYYVTSGGLGAERQLRLSAKSGSGTSW